MANYNKINMKHSKYEDRLKYEDTYSMIGGMINQAFVVSRGKREDKEVATDKPKNKRGSKRLTFLSRRDNP